jgi:hypothetical protein
LNDFLTYMVNKLGRGDVIRTSHSHAEKYLGINIKDKGWAALIRVFVLVSCPTTPFRVAFAKDRDTKQQ